MFGNRTSESNRQRHDNLKPRGARRLVEGAKNTLARVNNATTFTALTIADTGLTIYGIENYSSRGIYEGNAFQSLLIEKFGFLGLIGWKLFTIGIVWGAEKFFDSHNARRTKQGVLGFSNMYESSLVFLNIMQTLRASS